MGGAGTGSAFGENPGGSRRHLRSLCLELGNLSEALYLARLVVQLQPDNPECRGLLSLMLHCEARKAARQGADGCFIPLAQQEVAQWNAALIAQAEQHLYQAAALGRAGPYQLEAAIQSAHNQRLHGLATP